MSGTGRGEGEPLSPPVAAITDIPSTTAAPRNPSLASVPTLGVVPSSTDALPSAPPLATTESRPSPLTATDSRPGLPPAYSGAALTPWSASTTFNPQSVDWAALPPPPDYASRREADDLRIPSYRTLDVGYTRGAPPRYDPVCESNESEPTPSLPPGTGATPGRRRASSATSNTSQQRRRSSAASGQRGTVPVDSPPENPESTKWCMFFLLFILGVSICATLWECVFSVVLLFLALYTPAQIAHCFMSASVSKETARLAHTHPTPLAPFAHDHHSRTSRP